MTNLCRICKNPSSYGKANICKECNKIYHREYYRKNKEKLNEKEKLRLKKRRSNVDFVMSERQRGREYWANLRHEAIMAYGGYKCACCEEKEPLFLSIDHIENNGADHRRELGIKNGNGKGGNTVLYIWLKRNNYPVGFQILCMNCNMGKSRNKGICPHKAIS